MRGVRRLIAGLALVAVSGCAAPSLAPSPTVPEPTTTTIPGPTTTTLSPEAGGTRFQACLRTSGVEVPPIPLDAQGRLRLELSLARIDFSVRANVLALDECAGHLTEGPLALEGSPLITDGVRAALAGFSECIRSRGVRGFPDPVDDFNGVGSPYPAELIPFHDPDLPDAVEDCRESLGA